MEFVSNLYILLFIEKFVFFFYFFLFLFGSSGT